MLRRLTAIAVLFGLCWLTTSQAQPPAKGKGDNPKSKSKSDGDAKSSDLKKYDDVITKEAKTSPGIFAVHRIDDKVYFEIPTTAMGKLMLWQAEVAKGPAGVSWGGRTLGSNVIRWERRGNKIYLWQGSFDKRAEGKNIQKAVDSATQEPIIAAFTVECEGKDRSAVILANPLFTTELADLSVKGAVGAGGSIDGDRSWIEDVRAFPKNIEVRSLLTFRGGGGGGMFGRGPIPAGQGAGAGKSFTALVHYSMVLLPETPMQGRFFDPRVGYFTESFEDYSSEKKWSANLEYITRYRLEKKDPAAMVSEPVTPITFYLSPEIPEIWRPYMKKGVEDWQPAFEKAGFKNAIICKDPPTKAEDPNWDPEDARYSVIRWVAEPIANAMGPHVHDPRSGEVISAHIIFWNDILKITQQWYFVQCSAQDPRARKLPLPVEITGELMRYVTAHEVGHTLGLRHNHRASSAYTIEQLRTPDFTAKHGTVASIMAYGRFNYVAQPEDKVKQMIPIVGPYDDFAIEWGYKPIPSAKTALQEKPTLDKWAARQIEEPWLRFGGEDAIASIDPTVKTENIGSDTLKATELGLKNVDKVLDYLVEATTSTGEDFTMLQEVYGAVMRHRANWFGAVARNVGGVVESRTLGGRGTESFTRVPRKLQKESVDFLIANLFNTPTKLLQPALVNRFKFSGIADDVSNQQALILKSLLSPARVGRLMDAEVLASTDAYTAIDLIGDVQNGVWSEITGAAPAKIDPLRRTLQRTYLEHMKAQLAPPTAPAQTLSPFGLLSGRSGDGSDFRAVARLALADLASKIQTALSKVTDPITKAHLADSLSQIETMLAPPKK